MSYREANDPRCQDAAGGVDLAIHARPRDLGGFAVRRVLPAGRRRMVGPFIFFDHMGPAEFPPGKGINVRPHPHIGLATITYLFEGELMHRDSLGYEQAIRPGAVNLMTAGRGIVHSERAGSDLGAQSQLHGIQSWIALPADEEECEPAFDHVAADRLPSVDRDGTHIRIIMGEAFGAKSPVPTYSETLYLELQLAADAALTIPCDGREVAAYIVDGAARVDGHDYSEGTMAVAAPDRGLAITALRDSHVMIVGGAPVGERHIWWNFVSSRRERIEQAKSDWRDGRFEAVPGDDEFIPLPD